MINIKKTERILCPSCGKHTNHEVVYEGRERIFEDKNSDIWESTTFDVLQCLGCETPTLRKKYIFSEDMDFEEIDGKNVIIPTITLWPKTDDRMLKQKYTGNSPQNVRRIYRETIEAYNSELPTLCGAGIRAVIECVCKEQGIIKEDLKDKIDALKEKGVITEVFANALHQNRLLGNEALHESTLFGDLELGTAIELIETLLDTVYETESKARLLKDMRESKKIKDGLKI